MKVGMAPPQMTSAESCAGAHVITLRGEKTEKAMTGHVSALAAATLLTTSIALSAEPVSAAPFSEAFAIKKRAASDVEIVRWSGGGRGWRGGWRGGGCCGAGGILGGATIGGALASPYYGYSSGSPYGSVYGYSCWSWVPVAWGGYARAWVC
jgi:hypothetical protein